MSFLNYCAAFSWISYVKVEVSLIECWHAGSPYFFIVHVARLSSICYSFPVSFDIYIIIFSIILCDPTCKFCWSSGCSSTVRALRKLFILNIERRPTYLHGPPAKLQLTIMMQHLA